MRMRHRSAAPGGLRRGARGGGAVPVQGTAPLAFGRAAVEGAHGGAPPRDGGEDHDYAAAAELNPQAAWTATPDGRLDHVNRRWGEWTGTEGLGRVWAAGLHPGDRARTIAAWRRAVATGEPYDVEHRVKMRDGAHRWMHSRARPRRDGEGRVAKWYGTTEDIHDRKAAEEARRRAEDELRLLNDTLEERVERRTRELAEAQAALVQAQKMEAVGQLTGGIAHDFNNLLTVITGNLDMARRSMAGGDEPRAQRQMDNAMQGARRAATLTQRLLAFSRNQPLAPRAVDVNRLVAGLAADLLARTLGAAVAFEAAPAPGLWPAAADPHQLENALLNLAVNARDAMVGCADARLAVRTANVALDTPGAEAAGVPPGRYVEVAVSDTGAGMPPEVLARVFEPFFTTKEAGKGTGLGLPMVFGFAKQSGGAVLVDSAVGRGTAVRLLLPAAAPGAEPAMPVAAAPSDDAADAPRPAAAGLGERPATVLLVEDQEEVGDLAEAILADAGHRVLRAPDGPAALAVLAGDDGRAVSLLFSDVMMPGGMSGLDLAREARALRPGLPVLLTTGYAQAAIGLRGGEADSGRPEFPFLDKPYRRGDLLAKVRETLTTRTLPMFKQLPI